MEDNNDIIIYDGKKYSLSELINKANFSKNKRNKKYFSAYLSILNSITGGEGDVITVKSLPDDYGENPDWYGYAAYDILSILKSMTPIAEESDKVDEPVKTEEVEVQYPKYSSNMFYSYLNNKLFGGLYKDDVKGFSTAWDRYADLDRDETGSRGISQRADILKSQLNNYKTLISNNNYDFKESAYSDKEDLLARINNAISALESGNERDIYTSLSSIGIVPEMVLNRGLDDVYGTVNNLPVTYRQYYAALKASKKEEEKEETKKELNTPIPNNISNTDSILNKSWDEKMLYRYTGPNINRNSKIKPGKVSLSKHNNIRIEESRKDPYSYTISASETLPVDISKDDINGIKNIIKKISKNYSYEDKSKLKEMGWLKHGGTINSNINQIVSNFINKLKYGRLL